MCRGRRVQRLLGALARVCVGWERSTEVHGGTDLSVWGGVGHHRVALEHWVQCDIWVQQKLHGGGITCR